MKRTLLILSASLLAAVTGRADSWSTNLTLNATIPDNNPGGLANAFTVSGLGNQVTGVTVNLDITGGFNGDLYGYLVGPNGGFAVLLNRTGLTGSNANGYGDAGFNITLSDGAPNGDIHSYQNVLNPGGAQLTGTWAPDGLNINPQSAGSVFDSTTPTAMLSSFLGTNPNGQWAFYFADLSPGDQSTLVNFGVTINSVPEPGTTALMGVAALFGINAWRRRSKS